MSPRRPLWHWFALAALVVVLDQISKHVIQQRLVYGESITVTPFFDLVLVFNPGAAFSFLADAGGWQRGFFIVLTLAISTVLIWMLRNNRGNRMLSIALALVIGGAFGNLYDRVAYGHVVDFIQWHVAGYYWPAFNIADSCICIGAGLLIFDSFRTTASTPKDDPGERKFKQ